jgi:hypothetical protein
MKIIMSLLGLLLFITCSTTDSTWNGGAQRQDALEDETRQEQQEHIRDQTPGGARF